MKEDKKPKIIWNESTWKEAVTQQLMYQARWDRKTAEDYAETIEFEVWEGYHPAEAVREEMSYWDYIEHSN